MGEGFGAWLVPWFGFTRMMGRSVQKVAAITPGSANRRCFRVLLHGARDEVQTPSRIRSNQKERSNAGLDL
jgi:hypothetical protein